MSQLFLLSAGLALCLCLSWGPGSHLEFAQRVYRSRKRKLHKENARLLSAAPNAYFYGNLAADIVNLKNWGGHLNHCHRWTIIEDMQALAQDDHERAFVLGYLSHLAADTIAHNHYVPYHLARYARSKGLGHLYWEMRADSFVPEERWKLITRLKSDPELGSLDELLNRCMSKRALPRVADKLIFNHVLLISERNRWRRGVERLHGLSWAPLEEDFLDRFRHAAVARIRLALGDAGPADLAHIDTTGRKAQQEAWRARKRIMRSLQTPTKRRAAGKAAAEGFLSGMQSPPPSGGPAIWERACPS